MEYRTIGNTGIKLPPVIFGTSALGNLYHSLDDETKTSIVAECFRHVPAPVVFDSAGKYGAGMALEKLGEILNDLGHSPSDVIISNKLGWLRTPLITPEPTFEHGVWMEINNDARQNISYEGIIECWEQGNELLGGRFKPQMVSVHDPDEYLAAAHSDEDCRNRLNNIIEAYQALSELKHKGEVRAVGVGAKNWRTIQIITGEISLDWVMFANSMTIYRHPAELLEFMDTLHSQGISMINSAVFHGGFLTGGSFFDYVPVKPDAAGDKAKYKWREDFFAICKRHDVHPADACVRFAMTPPGVVSISLNTSNPSHVVKNVKSVESMIPESFWKEMLRSGLIDRNYPYL
jgi:D-threo-aldose 1-dehydrogenase